MIDIQFVEDGQMLKKLALFGFAGLVLTAILLTTGCLGTGPTLGVASIPVPVSPYFQQGYEDLAFEKERYNKVAILPPITESEHHAQDPPSDDLVMRQLEKIRPVSGSVPGTETTYRNVKGITKEIIADYVDPPRVMPLVGPVQLHHVHYKCTVYFEETTNVGWPVPYTIKNEDAMEVFYIDLDHLHRVAGGQVDVPNM
ncbi:MAG: hypothetical protein LBG58_14740 [Planctomycetaceae bacterium]|jgi:hypothetical protein|nr:hypothetical protein [Planctomycetaceae bacterium]